LDVVKRGPATSGLAHVNAANIGKISDAPVHTHDAINHPEFITAPLNCPEIGCPRTPLISPS
jgi:hypothetical protein